MALLKDWFGWEGPLTAQLRRTEETHQDNRAKIQSILQTEEGRRFLMEAQKKMQNARADYYARGGDGVDPNVKDAEDIGKVRDAREKTKYKDDKTGEMKERPETAAWFNIVEQNILSRRNRRVKEEERHDFVGPPAPAGKPNIRRPETETPTSKSAAEYLTDDFVGPPAPLKHDRFEGQLPPKPDEGMFDRLGDYFQAPTETVPEANIPKTYQQLGISSVDDMATLDEIQKALPDRDMKAEYEQDPESMQRLMRLWKARKIDKSDLRKLFSAIQQKARQALGVA